MSTTPNGTPRSFFSFPAVWITSAYALGAGIAQLFAPPVHTAAAVSILVAGALYFFRRRRIAFVLLLLSLVLLGGLRLAIENTEFGDTHVRTLYDNGTIPSGDPVRLTGRAEGAPEPAIDGYRLRVRVETIEHDGEVRDTRGAVQLFVAAASEEAADDMDALDLRTGSRVSVSCRLKREDEYLDPGVMSRKQLLDRKGIDASATLKSPLLIQRTSDPAIPSPVDLLFAARSALIRDSMHLFEPETAGVVTATLLGEKDLLGRDSAELFRSGGTFHILVISGLHITFIGALLFWIAIRIFRRPVTAAFVTAAAVWLFSLAVGAEVPVVRAAIMFTVYLFGTLLHRSVSPLNSLALSCLVILAWRPQDLFDPSFHLTMMSVAAIVCLCVPLLKRLHSIGEWMPSSATPFPPNVGKTLGRICGMLYWRPERWEEYRERQIWSGSIPEAGTRERSWWFARPLSYLFDALIVSAVVQCAMLPLSIIYFHRLSFSSLLLNIWVSAVIVIESVFAVIALLLYRVSHFLATPFAWFADRSNDLLLALPRVLASFEFSSLRIPVYSGYGRWVYAAFLLMLIVIAVILSRWNVFTLERRSVRPATLAAIFGQAVILFVMVLHPYSSPRPDGQLHVEFLDVGQGDSALVTFPDGRTLLIDGGGRPDRSDEEFEPDVPRIGEFVVSEFLWERGYSSIDDVLASHADADHAQGLSDVVLNFRVGKILLGPTMGEAPEIAALRQAAEKRSTPIRDIARGDGFEDSGVMVEVLWPPRNIAAVSENNASVVVRITFGDTAFLFTGDIEKEAEAALLSERTVLRSTLIKVPHHGSRTSSTEGFVNAVDPVIAVISVGRHSVFGHPHREVVERWAAHGTRVITTGSNGLISITSDGKRLRVNGEW